VASVFHYTDSGGAVGILTTRSLFASDSRYLNDYSEGALIDTLLSPILLAEVATATKELVEAGLLDKRYYQEQGSKADSLQVDALFRSIRTATNNISPVYVVSFCRHEEGSEQFKNGLLSQWRGYAGRGGFALEFDEEGLEALISHEIKRFFFGPVVRRDVLYDDFQKLFDPKDYVGLARAMIGKMFLDPKVTPIADKENRAKVKEIAGNKNIDEAVSKFLSTAPFLKNSGFHEEREFRLAIAGVRQGRVPAKAKKDAKPVEFRVRGDLIVPYIRLFGGPKTKLPIRSIIVGPHPHQELQREAMSHLLENAKIDASVRLSEIPFRGS